MKQVFDDLPIPPSSNNQYKILIMRGRVIHAPSKELVAYRKAMDAYWLKNQSALFFAKDAFAGLPLSIHAEFWFERSRILTKKGTFKRLDVSNRLKALHDSIAEALLMDDCCFTHVSAEKRAVTDPTKERVRIEVGPAEFVES